MIVSDACQIKDLDHIVGRGRVSVAVSDACQIKDLDHRKFLRLIISVVSDACQIKDLDHEGFRGRSHRGFQMPVRSKT